MSTQKLTGRERAIVEVVRLNERNPMVRVIRKARVGRWEVKYERRSRNNLWGRFGGGWNWHIGAQVGGSTIVVFLLVCSISIRTIPEPTP